MSGQDTKEDEAKKVSQVTVYSALVLVVFPFALHCGHCFDAGGNFLLWIGLFFPPLGVYHGYQIIFGWLNIII